MRVGNGTLVLLNPVNVKHISEFSKKEEKTTHDPPSFPFSSYSCDSGDSPL